MLGGPTVATQILSMVKIGHCPPPQMRFQSSRPATFAEITEALATMEAKIDFNEKELKQQYRTLVKKHHPDAGGSETAMSKISVSYNLLTGLSTHEKQQYELQRKNATRSGGSGNGGGFQHHGVNRNPSGPHSYRTTSYEGSGFDPNWQQTADYAKAYAQGRQQHHYSYRRNNQENGAFSGGDPFAAMGMSPMSPFARAMRRAGAARNGDASRMILRALAVYFLASVFVAYLFRRYRDRAFDDGWKQAESLSRHEQMQELHRIRQELKEKMSAAEAARYQQNYGGGGTSMGMMGAFGQKRRHDDDVERVKELRALEYAKQRQLDMTNIEIKGWPKFDPSKGRIWRTANDPAGVIYFDPDPASLVDPSLNQTQQSSLQSSPAIQNGNYVMQQAPSTSRNSSAIINDAMAEQRTQQAEFIASKSRLAAERTTST